MRSPRGGGPRPPAATGFSTPQPVGAALGTDAEPGNDAEIGAFAEGAPDPVLPDVLMVAAPSGATSNGDEPKAGVVDPLAGLRAEVATLAAETRVLQAQVAALYAVERFRDVVLARHASYPAPPPPTRRLDARDFADAVDGFHHLEYDGQGAAYRWTGPGHFTRARFHVDRSAPLMVVLRLSSLGVHTARDRITVDIDGTVYPMRRLGGEEIALGAGPVAPRDEDGLTELFFHIPQLFSPRDTGFADQRLLGVCLLSIELAPES